MEWARCVNDICIRKQNDMKTATPTYASFTGSYAAAPGTSLLSRFATWCADQQENSLLWLGIALTGHGCILTPITIMVVLMSGAHLFFFMLAMAAMGASLVTNLAAMPTRITIPVFILSILVDVAILAACLGINV